MKVLDLEECFQVAKKINTGVPIREIAKRFGIDESDVKLIAKCKREKYPLGDYKLISDPNYKYTPLNEPDSPWDLRLSLRLSRLPMSQWSAAL